MTNAVLILWVFKSALLEILLFFIGPGRFCRGEDPFLKYESTISFVTKFFSGVKQKKWVLIIYKQKSVKV
jgi:hypothetical protein